MNEVRGEMLMAVALLFWFLPFLPRVRSISWQLSTQHSWRPQLLLISVFSQSPGFRKHVVATMVAFSRETFKAAKY